VGKPALRRPVHTQSTRERPMTDLLKLTVVPRPSELPMRDRGTFLLDIVVSNPGPTAIDPSLKAARLSINGEDSVYFALTMGNRVHYPSKPLAPSHSETTSWPGMGPTLFPRPGSYTLVLSLGEVSAPPVVVRLRR
jgi:hypothetical protein